VCATLRPHRERFVVCPLSLAQARFDNARSIHGRRGGMKVNRFVAAVLMSVASAYAFAQGAETLQAPVAACAQDTGPADCPVTYQTIRASDCLGAGGNRACLIRMAKEAAAANDCNRAYQLVYACQCNTSQEAGRSAIKAAGPSGVCKYLKGS
jgi:hypothetical protein